MDVYLCIILSGHSNSQLSLSSRPFEETVAKIFLRSNKTKIQLRERLMCLKAMRSKDVEYFGLSVCPITSLLFSECCGKDIHL